MPVYIATHCIRFTFREFNEETRSLLPMALGLEAGSEQYAPLARSIIGGLVFSVIVTIFLVPAAYLLIHRKEEQPQSEVQA